MARVTSAQDITCREPHWSVSFFVVPLASIELRSYFQLHSAVESSVRILKTIGEHVEARSIKLQKVRAAQASDIARNQTGLPEARIR